MASPVFGLDALVPAKLISFQTSLDSRRSLWQILNRKAPQPLVLGWAVLVVGDGLFSWTAFKPSLDSLAPQG